MAELSFKETDRGIKVSEDHTGYPVGEIDSTTYRGQQVYRLSFPAWKDARDVYMTVLEDPNAGGDISLNQDSIFNQQFTGEGYAVSYGKPFEGEHMVEGVEAVEIETLEPERYAEDIADYVEQFHKDPDISGESWQFVASSLEKAGKELHPVNI